MGRPREAPAPCHSQRLISTTLQYKPSILASSSFSRLDSENTGLVAFAIGRPDSGKGRIAVVVAVRGKFLSGNSVADAKAAVERNFVVENNHFVLMALSISA